MKVKEQAIIRVIEKLKLDQNQLRFKLYGNKQQISKLAEDQTIIKKELHILNNIINDIDSGKGA